MGARRFVKEGLKEVFGGQPGPARMGAGRLVRNLTLSSPFFSFSETPPGRRRRRWQRLVQNSASRLAEGVEAWRHGRLADHEPLMPEESPGTAVRATRTAKKFRDSRPPCANGEKKLRRRSAPRNGEKISGMAVAPCVGCSMDPAAFGTVVSPDRRGRRPSGC